MPGAANGAIDDEPVDERPMIVGAISADRECFRSLPRKQHRFVPDVADQLAAIGELGERHALRQIGTGLIFRHSALLEHTPDAFPFGSTGMGNRLRTSKRRRCGGIARARAAVLSQRLLRLGSRRGRVCRL